MSRTITNNANLPPPLYNALANDSYVGGGDISVTRLIAPPRIVTLTKVHENEITEDATERVWSVLGQSVHAILERAASADVKVETRLFMPIEGLHLEKGIWKWNLSGQPDLYEPKNATLSDYKVTSVWSLIFGKIEWEQQINLQAMLHRYKGDRVERGQIIGIIRDWQKSKARVQIDYPPVALKVLNIPLWTQNDAVRYSTERVKLHQQSQMDYEASGNDVTVLPLCTPEERWYRGQKFAVKRANKLGKINKKADRLFDNEADAKRYIDDNRATIPKGTVFVDVEERPGQNIRCLEYCPVARFCDFGRKQLEAASHEHLDFKDRLNGGSHDEEEE